MKTEKHINWSLWQKNDNIFHRFKSNKYAIPPVMLLYGEQNVDKLSLATGIAALFFCQTHTACGTCSECKEIMTARHPEILWIGDDKKTISISDAAFIQEHLALKSGGFNNNEHDLRIAIISDIEKMTLQAANRLLKTLEEPPENSMIILTTNSKSRLLPTILSRCIQIKVKDAGDKDILNYLNIDKELQQDLYELITTDNIVFLSTKLSAKDRISIENIIKTTEILLNKYYKETSSKNIDYIRLIKRRKALKKIKDLARNQKIYLNKQLILEEIGGLGRL